MKRILFTIFVSLYTLLTAAQAIDDNHNYYFFYDSIASNFSFTHDPDYRSMEEASQASRSILPSNGPWYFYEYEKRSDVPLYGDNINRACLKIQKNPFTFKSDGTGFAKNYQTENFDFQNINKIEWVKVLPFIWTKNRDTFIITWNYSKSTWDYADRTQLTRLTASEKVNLDNFRIKAQKNLRTKTNKGTFKLYKFTKDIVMFKVNNKEFGYISQIGLQKLLKERKAYMEREKIRLNIQKQNASQQSSQNIYNDGIPIYEIVDEAPYYPGGKDALMTYFTKRIKKPEGTENISGKVVLRFIVGIWGGISNVEVIESLHPNIDKEVKRIANAMQNWQPGKIDGKPVRCYFTLPVLID